MKKRVFSLILAMVMVLVLVVGCGAQDKDSTKDSSDVAETKEAANDAPIANEDIKIGVSIWSSTDVLGSQCKLILEDRKSVV